MHPLVCVLFVCVFTLDYVRSEFGLPQVLGLVPELLSGVALLMVFNGIIANGLKMRASYLLVFAIFVLVVLAGLVIADASAGPLVGGIRFYGKYVPFMLLPMVFEFSERQLQFQMKLLLGLALLQLPVTFLQRFVIYAGGSGDLARGTFTSGSQNAIVLLSVIAVITGFYNKRLLSGAQAVIIGVLLFLPSTMAEVKGAFVLMPIALLLPTLFSTGSKPSAGLLLRTSIVLVLALGTYSLLYNLAESTRDRTVKEEHRTSILEFILDPRSVLLYLAPKLAGSENANREGRIDQVVEPLIEHKDDLLKLATGLGLGALSKSPFKALSSDQHAHILANGRARVTMSYLLWEIGILGTLVVLVALFLVWRDALHVRHSPHPIGAIALGWLAVVPIFFLAMFWKNTIINNAVMFLFAYYSGHIMAAGYRLRNGPFPQQDIDLEIAEGSVELVAPPILNEARRSST